MKLYNYFRSSAAFRVRIALNLKGLEYEHISKSLVKHEHRAADYLALNPQGLIPALEVDGTVISQSLAIIEYLNDLQPQPPLLPADPLARAQVRSMALAIACDIHPLNNLRVLNYLRQDLAQNDEGVNTWYRHWISAGFRGLEQQVAKHSSARRHCFGDSLSLADVCLVPQMYNARRFKTDLSPFPTLVAISTHLETMPAFDAARPEAQPDAQ
ncbi:maleylacetoacetate isomerase [Steroidobacter cummioxidans]|uniref:maleylacetoacetate isomerase n=1 Tax=Steroidobacter cummioxidans TaxID=1803913 RepID=UPI000E30C3EC|nr:maleylacetoacetate isomerase [Steroidobacter cummioxidans]